MDMKNFYYLSFFSLMRIFIYFTAEILRDTDSDTTRGVNLNMWCFLSTIQNFWAHWAPRFSNKGWWTCTNDNISSYLVPTSGGQKFMENTVSQYSSRAAGRKAERGGGGTGASGATWTTRGSHSCKSHMSVMDPQHGASWVCPAFVKP